MARPIRSRSLIVLALLVIPVVLIGLVATVPSLAARLMGSSSAPRGAVSHPREQPTASAKTPLDSGPASLRLVAQDLTPDAKLGLTGSGFMGKEHLNVSVEDRQGQSYMQVSLTAGEDGRLGETSLTLPQHLAAGDYRLVVVGSASHRTASIPFRMHVVPPTVTLDAYTAKPGQEVGFAGSGFLPGEVVQVYLGTESQPLASVKATGLGAISGHMGIPKLPAGNYTLTVTGESSRTPASVGFNIQGFAPWVVLSRYALTQGQSVGFIGQGFAPGEQVLVYLNSVQTKPVMTLTADTDGRVVVQDTWTPDAAASGRNVLTLVGQTSQATTTADFTILPGAQSTPSPTTSLP